jgi:hypothetical protein
MNLVFAIPDPERAIALEHPLASRPEFQVKQTRQRDLTQEVDAVYVSITAAERWGAHKRPLIHQAQVFRTRPEDRAEGWPPFVIAGLTARPDEDPFDPRLMPLIIKAAIVAARRFNARGDELIESIAFEPSWTLIDRLPPLEAAEMIRAAYDEAMGIPEDKLDEYGRVEPHIIATVDFATTAGTRSRNEWRCLFEFRSKRCECALILEELPRLDTGQNEGVPIEFLCPEADWPQMKVGDQFSLWEGRRKIAEGVVQSILRSH